MMKRFFPIATMFLALLCVARAEDNELARSRITVAMRTVPVLMEFSQLYPNSFYRLEKQAGRHIIEGRTLLTPFYELIIKLPIADPRTSTIVRQLGPADIELLKIEEITGPRDKPEPRYSTHSIRLDTRQWVQLVMAEGDFGKIGIKLEGEIMLRRLDEYRDRLREEAHVGW